MDNIEELWERILSRDKELIKKAFLSLNQEEKQQILAHLNEMSSGSGWHKEQKNSADAALKVIIEINK
jgi:hypothetical protein